jgi:hypothetical protein
VQLQPDQPALKQEDSFRANDIKGKGNNPYGFDVDETRNNFKKEKMIPRKGGKQGDPDLQKEEFVRESGHSCRNCAIL